MRYSDAMVRDKCAALCKAHGMRATISSTKQGFTFWTFEFFQELHYELDKEDDVPFLCELRATGNTAAMEALKHFWNGLDARQAMESHRYR